MKRKSKAQREKEARAALLQRITDIYSGALGLEWTDEEFATSDTLSRIAPALREIFGPQVTMGASADGEPVKWPWEPHNLDHFEDPETATEFLFDGGFRA